MKPTKNRARRDIVCGESYLQRSSLGLTVPQRHLWDIQRSGLEHYSIRLCIL